MITTITATVNAVSASQLEVTVTDGDRETKSLYLNKGNNQELAAQYAIAEFLGEDDDPQFAGYLHLTLTETFSDYQRTYQTTV